MNFKTSLLENYVNYVDSTKKQKTYFKINIGLFVFIVSLDSFHLHFEYLKGKHFFFSLTSNFDSNLKFRHCKSDLRARFMEIKSINTKLRQDQTAIRIRLFK